MTTTASAFPARVLACLMSVFIFIFPVFPVKAAQSERVLIVYFYSSVCEQCNEVEKFIDKLDDLCSSNGIGAKPEVNAYNIADAYGLKLFQKYAGYFHVPEGEWSAPMVFAGDSYLMGEENIRTGLGKLLQQDNIPETKKLDVGEKDGQALETRFQAIQALEVLGVGFVNGFNPCMISMYLFFISLLLTKDVNIKKTAVSFCLAKFFTYLFLGTLLYNLLQFLQFDMYNVITKVFIGLFIGFVICLNMKDFFAVRKEQYEHVSNQLPKAIRTYNHQWIKRLSAVADSRNIILLSLLLGVVVSVGEFLCTGQIYLATILYILHNNMDFSVKAFLYLVVYDVGFLIPLVLLTLFLLKGKEIFQVSEFIRGKLPWIKLANSVIFLLLGLLIIFFT